jgi:hypothetical protein
MVVVMVVVMAMMAMMMMIFDADSKAVVCALFFIEGCRGRLGEWLTGKVQGEAEQARLAHGHRLVQGRKKHCASPREQLLAMCMPLLHE